MLGIAKLTGGVLCGCALSQFPEYSQQYVQRMGGAIDELETVVQDFDNTAQASGYTRTQALETMIGSDFLEARQKDMQGTFKRYENLSTDYERLKSANAYSRLAYVARMRDFDIAKGVAKDFQPAVPLTMVGASFVLIGFIFGYALLAGIFRLFKKRPKQASV